MVKQYKIVKYKNMYKLIDTLAIELGNWGHSDSDRIHITKSDKVYIIHSYEVVDDWFADIGHITHFEESKTYLGKLIFESEDIEEVALKFAELKSSKSRMGG